MIDASFLNESLLNNILLFYVEFMDDSQFNFDPILAPKIGAGIPYEKNVN